MSNTEEKKQSLNHLIRHADDLSWYAECSGEAQEIGNQIYHGEDANFWATMLLVFAAVCELIGIIFLSCYRWYMWALSIFLAWAVACKIKVRLKRRVTINYEMDETSGNTSTLMLSPFIALTNSEEIKEITGEESYSDTNHIKNHAGSNCDLSHKCASVKPRLSFPVCSNRCGVTVCAGGATIIALADCVYVLRSDKCTPVPFSQVRWDVSSVKIIEEIPPSDVEILGETWQHVNMNGNPDRRFNENKKLFICRHGEILLTVGDVFGVKLLVSNIKAAEKIHDFAVAVNKL